MRLIEGVNAGGGIGRLTSGDSDEFLLFLTGVTGRGAGGNVAASGVVARGGNEASGLSSFTSTASPPAESCVPVSSPVGAFGNFFGEMEYGCFGECNERNHRTRPRCTPRSPIIYSSFSGICQCHMLHAPTGRISGRLRENIANMSTGSV